MKLLKKPILITGASGFVGSNLTRYLVKKGIRVNIIIKKSSNVWRLKDIFENLNVYYADISNKKKIQTIIKKIKPKTIFHLATHGAYSSQSNTDRIKSTILDGTINLINECSKYRFDAFINTGSSSEYGFKDKKMKENDLLVPNSYYSLFKSSATMFCQYMSLKNNLPITTIRPFHVYGPYEEPSRLIPTLLKKLTGNKKVKLVSPDISRDLIYIDDVVNFYILIAKKNKLRGEIFNLGYGKKTTIKNIYDYLRKITNYKNFNKWSTMKNRSWDQKVWFSDMTHVKKKLKWNPKIDYKKGLYQTLIWHKEFYKKK
jgi:nucleoside-diphosphate-sugar epimerase